LPHLVPTISIAAPIVVVLIVRRADAILFLLVVDLLAIMLLLWVSRMIRLVVTFVSISLVFISPVTIVFWRFVVVVL